MGSENYSLGRGKVYVGEWSAGVFPATYEEMGNAPEVSLELTEETLEHYNSQAGLRTKDKSVTLETGYNLKITTDELSSANLARFVKGTITAATVTDNLFITGNDVLDQEFAIKFVADNPAGPNYTYYFWRVKLKPSGEIAMISDEWAQMAYEGEGLKVDAADVATWGTDPDTAYFKIEEMDTATG